MTEREKNVSPWFSKINRFSLGYRGNGSQEKDISQKMPWISTRIQKTVLLYPTCEASEIEFKARTVLKAAILT